MDIHHVLWPTDLSDAATRALPAVISVAEKYGARVSVLHVQEDINRYEVQAALLSEEQDDRLQDRMTTEILENLDEICAELGARCGEYTKHVLTGEPATVIGEYADREQVDLVVMATRGQGAVKRLAFGSVTDKVLQEGRTPVLAIPVR
jgi:nucleotide-binding universal stress UspA family protein